MKLYYHKERAGNFGDDLNPWLWDKFFPDYFNNDDSEIFIGVGTLLNTALDKYKIKHVFGSGVGYGKAPKIDNSWHIHFVRGPMTAEILGIEREKAITDPAILCSLFKEEFKSDESFDVSYIPHHHSIQKGDWERVCNAASVNYIDPTLPFKDVLNKISASKLVITEAMHGAIIADAFRIPWSPVKCYPHILDFKWMDWASTMNLNVKFNILDPVWKKQNNGDLVYLVKNQIKRVSRRVGYWDEKWIPPFTTSKEYDSSVKNLLKIVEDAKINSLLSDKLVFESNISKVVDKINLFSNQIQ